MFDNDSSITPRFNNNFNNYFFTNYSFIPLIIINSSEVLNEKMLLIFFDLFLIITTRPP